MVFQVLSVFYSRGGLVHCLFHCPGAQLMRCFLMAPLLVVSFDSPFSVATVAISTCAAPHWLAGACFPVGTLQVTLQFMPAIYGRFQSRFRTSFAGFLRVSQLRTLASFSACYCPSRRTPRPARPTVRLQPLLQDLDPPGTAISHSFRQGRFSGSQRGPAIPRPLLRGENACCASFPRDAMFPILPTCSGYTFSILRARNFTVPRSLCGTTFPVRPTASNASRVLPTHIRSSSRALRRDGTATPSGRRRHLHLQSHGHRIGCRNPDSDQFWWSLCGSFRSAGVGILNTPTQCCDPGTHCPFFRHD